MAGKRERDEMGSIDHIEKKTKYDEWNRQRNEFKSKFGLRYDLMRLVFEFLDYQCLYTVIPLVCKSFLELAKEIRPCYREIRLTIENDNNDCFCDKISELELDMIKNEDFLKKLKIFHIGAKSIYVNLMRLQVLGC